eukprot:218613_1
MSCALISPQASQSERFSKVQQIFSEMCGGTKIGFQNATYLSEKATADRNFCLAYMMREMKSFPADTNVKATLEFYFQVCSQEMNCTQMATLAATLANGGMCPTTNKVVFDAPDVRNCLSLMLSCGMYDYSGEWAFRVGLPAKSGVGGAIFIVVPNKMGICIWSPRLDSMGNSVRGVEFAKKLVERFNFHHMDNLRGILAQGDKIDPCMKVHERRESLVTQLLFAASRGALKEVKRLIANGADIWSADYDSRTALHLAASESQTNVIQYILQEFGADADERAHINAEDRWGETALDDAAKVADGAGDDVDCAQKITAMLQKFGGRRGSIHDAKAAYIQESVGDASSIGARSGARKAEMQASARA